MRKNVFITLISLPCVIANVTIHAQTINFDQGTPKKIYEPTPQIPSYPNNFNSLFTQSNIKNAKLEYLPRGMEKILTPYYEVELKNPPGMSVIIDPYRNQFKQVIMPINGNKTIFYYHYSNVSKPNDQPHYNLAMIQQEVGDAIYTWWHHSGSDSIGTNTFPFKDSMAGQIIDTYYNTSTTTSNNVTTITNTPIETLYPQNTVEIYDPINPKIKAYILPPVESSDYYPTIAPIVPRAFTDALESIISLPPTSPLEENDILIKDTNSSLFNEEKSSKKWAVIVEKISQPDSNKGIVELP